jgi:ATP-binding cassette subfamily E protein 1
MSQLSGGELQRVAIATLCVQQADVYLVDEPSAYLDIRQRIRAAKSIREALRDTTYVVVVEHDLAVLDYVSDQVCCLWGAPGAYGAVTAPCGSSEGINQFLDGYIKSENLRIREEPLIFRTAKDHDEVSIRRTHCTEYPSMQKFMAGSAGAGGGFQLDIETGDFAESEVIVMLGENGSGKTTFIKMLKEKLEQGDAMATNKARLIVSCKPQHVVPRYQGTVRELLLEKINGAFLDPQFQSDVVKPMNVDKLSDLQVLELSGGQLQSVALVLTLGKPADMYLIDEPSAYLDVEQRVAAARVIRRFILHQKKTAFVVEHDFMMAMYLADRVIVFDGRPGIKCCASSPMPLAEGMNKYLSQLNITFRAGRNGRPRINKSGGLSDREQKQSGDYFFVERY